MFQNSFVDNFIKQNPRIPKISKDTENTGIIIEEKQEAKARGGRGNTKEEEGEKGRGERGITKEKERGGNGIT